MPSSRLSQLNFPQMTQMTQMTQVMDDDNAPENQIGYHVVDAGNEKVRCLPHFSNTLNNILSLLGVVGFGRQGVCLVGECNHFDVFNRERVDQRVATRQLADLRAIAADMFEYMTEMMAQGLFCIHTDCMDFVEFARDYIREDVQKFLHRRGTKGDLYGALHTVLCVLLRYGARSNYSGMDNMERLYDQLQDSVSELEQRAIYGPVDDPQDPAYGQEYEGVLHEHRFLADEGVPDWKTFWEKC